MFDVGSGTVVLYKDESPLLCEIVTLTYCETDLTERYRNEEVTISGFCASKNKGVVNVNDEYKYLWTNSKAGEFTFVQSVTDWLLRHGI